MPGFRKLIAEENAKKEHQEFVNCLVNAGLILGGIWLVGKCMEEKE